MHETVLNSGWVTILFAVPALFILLLGVFHLDELLVPPRQSARTRRTVFSVDQKGRTVLCDPDGHPFHLKKTRK
ncbi:MAG TPA: hypothetical protein VGT08_05940 [Terracidiphilus sp.]|nr:hypothetical protein [Terracidiphilus sp.]